MQPSYGRPHYAPEPPAVSLTKARPWLVGLAASATMLVLIVAIGNPPVTRTILRHAFNAGFGSRVFQSLSSFAWNFSSPSDDMHVYLANLIADIAVLLLVLLFVAALSSGSGSFWRTFLAVWVSVIAAVTLSGYVRAAIINPMGSAPDNNKAEEIFFSQYSTGPGQLFAALIFGVIAAIVAALVGVLTRRHQVVTADRPAVSPTPLAEPQPPAAAQKREPWAAPPVAVPGPVADPSPWSTTGDYDDDHTTQLPAVNDTHDYDDGAEHTRALPRVEDDRPHG